MKNKKGFISISIIYSFFVVFLLLLVLIMTTYTTNRYEFNIFTKDEKKYHAEKTTIFPNTNNLIKYSNVDDHVGYYSYYYYRNNGGVITNPINYFFFPSSNINIGRMDVSKPTNIFVILGSYDEHNLDYNTFFGNSTAYLATELCKTHSKFDINQSNNNIILAPSLSDNYISWGEELSDIEGINDIQTGVINSLINILTKSNTTPSTMANIPNLHIYYIGYEDGGTGVTKLVANFSTTLAATVKYYIIDSNIVCSSTQCTSLNTTEYNNLRSRTTNENFYGYAKSADSIERLDGFFNNIGNPNNNHYTNAKEDVIGNIIKGA